MKLSDGFVIVCLSQVASGLAGVVFEGLLICESRECAETHKTVQTRLIEKDYLNFIVTHRSGAVQEPLSELFFKEVTVRKVAVKFNTKRAAETAKIRQIINIVTSLSWERPFFAVSMQDEIRNIQELHGNMFVEYVGTIEQEPRFTGNVTSDTRGSLSTLFDYYRPGDAEEVPETLIAPGLVMEFLEGQTIDDVLHLLDGKKRDHQQVCFLAQMVLAFGYELSRRALHVDVHARNAIVLNDSSTEFRFTNEITCKQIKITDMGRVIHNPGIFKAASELVQRIHKGILPQDEYSRSPELPEELLKLIARIFAQGGLKARLAIQVAMFIPGTLKAGERTTFRKILKHI